MSEIVNVHISQALSIARHQVAATVQLLTEGATIPFIARYRKEATGSLDELQVAAVQSEWKRLQELTKRKETILKSITEQGLLTDELAKKMDACWDLTNLEDLYLPYRPKRKTRASAAREKGLEPLAALILAEKENNPERAAVAFLNDLVPDAEAALAGARDIIAEWINENAEARAAVRRLFERNAMLHAKVIAKKKEEGIKYRDYYDHHEPLKTCPSHRLLAICRGEQEEILRVSIDIEEENAIRQLTRIFVKSHNGASAQIVLALKDAYKRLMAPSLETEYMNVAKAKADQEAIVVFSENLRQLLLSAPLGPKVIMAIDPGFRTGCKLVCLDAQGNLMMHTTIFPHPPQDAWAVATDTVKKLVQQYSIQAIAIGNGTAGRETERFIKTALGKDTSVEVFMVNEAGASIYSASEVAREEFSELDLTVRGAISIGRRLMDPLAELVKIDAKSIGVGQYQHDVNQDLLKESLDQVVISAVNQVGVNLNTASQHLLRYVSGIGPQLAKSILLYRQQNGPFHSRKALMKVTGLGAKAFEQSAGFLRIPGSENPLDHSAVHPERYALVTTMAKDLSCTVEELMKDPKRQQQIRIKDYVSENVGLPTLEDIVRELGKPGLDPRGEAEVFSFDENIKEITDLQIGMRLPGIVMNLAKFGAFVDIGIKENGLIHISQITNRFIKDPSEVLKLGQKVMVKIVEIDKERKRIQLTMKEG